MEQRTYICIDLKTFYASVECVERGLDPFTTDLVVADPTRTEKTICLAISPAMKAKGVHNRCRVFEIPNNIKYVMAQPRMKLYMQRSAEIYGIYLRYVSPDDIHVYSIDECFIDATPYLKLYETDAFSFAHMLMDAVFEQTKITATAGIGTNLFLAKVALDVTAKHEPDGIGYLDEENFKEKIWHHQPITDIWNIGPGIANRLQKYAVFDLAGVAAMKKETLFKEFGVNAEFLIDHANGYEPCTIKQIKDYKPESSGLGNGQVLACNYTTEQARTVLFEMVDGLVLDLVEKNMVASGVSLSVGFDKNAVIEMRPPNAKKSSSSKGVSSNNRETNQSANQRQTQDNKLTDKDIFDGGHGRIIVPYWRNIPKSNVSKKLPARTSSFKKIWAEFAELYDQNIPQTDAIRRINIGLFGLLPEEFEEFSLFEDTAATEKERKQQEAILAIKHKFGKNALLKASSLKEEATARERNEQVGGHHG